MIRTRLHRIYPSREQERKLEAFLGYSCDLYNALLQERRDDFAAAERATGRKRPWHPLDGPQRPKAIRHWDDEARKYVPIKPPSMPGMAERSRAFTQYRQSSPDDYPEGMPSLVQRDVLARVDRAFAAFFKRSKESGGRAGYPRFRSKARYDSVTFGLSHDNHTVDPETGEVRVTRTTGAGELRKNELYLVGLGSFPFQLRPRTGRNRRGVRLHRPIPDDAVPRSAVVRRSGGRWYVSIVLDLPTPTPEPHDRPDVGIDMGVIQWMTLSTGEMIDGPNAGERFARHVRRVQRKVSRRIRRGHAHSNRAKKAIQHLARAREHERLVRKDHRHKVTRDLTKRFGTIYVEKLSERKLTQAPENEKAPEMPAHVKRRLNRRILDQAWHECHECATYKAEEAGGSVVMVSPEYTTQLCSECGKLAPKPPSLRVHECPHCGYTAPRTVNSARNVLRLGRSKPGRAGPSVVNGGG